MLWIRAGFLVCLIGAGVVCPPAAKEARAQTYGKLYTREEIYAFSVQGFKLGMTREEAEAILKRDHWKGSWQEFTSPENTHTFTRGNSRLYLMLCYQADKKLHLWSIVEKQAFDRPRSANSLMNRAIGSIWIDTVIDQFGESSMEFSNPNGVNAYVYYLMHHGETYLPKLEVYLNGYEASYELTDRSMLGQRDSHGRLSLPESLSLRPGMTIA